jgi:hypothetical protein
MDSYVVTIYRRPNKDGGNLVGQVESIGNGASKTFQSEQELLACLAQVPPIRSTASRRTPKQK